MRHCRVQTAGRLGILDFTSSVDVTISNVGIWDSSGIGMILANNTGYVRVIDSNFDTIYPSKSSSYGVGLFIESAPGINSEYWIKNCKFINISSGSIKGDKNSALKIYFGLKPHSTKVVIQQCSFTNNTAWQGAALSIISFFSFALNVSALVEKSNFENNSAISKGGAVLASYLYVDAMDKFALNQNKIHFDSCNFTGNKASAGGGVYVHSAPGYDINLLNRVNFRNCKWTENVADYGSAVFISSYTSPGFFENGKLPTPVFEDCSFIKNRNSIHSDTKSLQSGEGSSNQSYSIIRYGRGALYVNSIDVEFQGEIKFIENNFSAVYLFSSRVKVTSNSCVYFIRNTGYRGGAINLRGVSSINVNDNTSLIFDSNFVQDRGGAIYHEALTNPSNFSVINCFLKYYGNHSIHRRNISVYFTDNRISASSSYRGQSIFLFSAVPCSQTGSSIMKP